MTNVYVSYYQHTRYMNMFVLKLDHLNVFYIHSQMIIYFYKLTITSNFSEKLSIYQSRENAWKER